MKVIQVFLGILVLVGATQANLPPNNRAPTSPVLPNTANRPQSVRTGSKVTVPAVATPTCMLGTQKIHGFKMLQGQRGQLNSIYATCVGKEPTARCVRVTDEVDRETPSFVPCPRGGPTPRLRGRDLMIVEDHVLLWPKATVCYEFKQELSRRQAVNLLRAMNTYITDVKSVRFLHWSECKPEMGVCNGCSIRVKITNNEPGCFAKLGYRTDVDRQLNLNKETNQGARECTILHELGHVLGLSHEHQHPDRSVVVLRPVSPGKERSYWKLTGQRKTPYDPTSIMHYDKKLCIPKPQPQGQKRFCDIHESPPEVDCIIPEEAHCATGIAAPKKLSGGDVKGLQQLYPNQLPEPPQEITPDNFAKFMKLDVEL